MDTVETQTFAIFGFKGEIKVSIFNKYQSLFVGK